MAVNTDFMNQYDEAVKADRLGSFRPGEPRFDQHSDDFLGKYKPDNADGITQDDFLGKYRPGGPPTQTQQPFGTAKPSVKVITPPLPPPRTLTDIVTKSTPIEIKKQADQSVKWFGDKIKDFKNPKSIIDSKNKLYQGRLNNTVFIGKMFLFNYDPKWKDELPYYDIFPLVFPIQIYDDGFLGLNLHYLPPMLRAKLMQALLDTANNNKLDDTTALNISYKILAGASQYGLFKPCVKRYLSSHVQSRFFYIHPTEWVNVVMMPLQRFKKASDQKVWRDSRKKAGI